MLNIMETNVLMYNLEINICTIFLLLILKFSLYKSNTNLSTDKLLFKYMLNLNLWFSFTDMVSNLFAGAQTALGEFLLVISNMANIELMTVISYLWILYVFIRTKTVKSRLVKISFAFPLAVSTVLLLINPFTEIVFSIDAQNFYHREWGVMVHWASSWFYIIIGTAFAIRAMRKAPNKIVKRTYLPLVYFIICPAVASIFQMLFYGLATTQIGLAIGMVMMFGITLSGEVNTDRLTLLNNRGGMENFVVNQLETQKFSTVTVFMMDLNYFKQINDKLGHIVGDEALQEAAKVLKKAVGVVRRRVFLCRYGGDEFVIIGGGMTAEEAELITESIRENAGKKNEEINYKFKLEFSIGRAEGSFETYDDFEKLLKEADREMYVDKKRLKGIK